MMYNNDVISWQGTTSFPVNIWHKVFVKVLCFVLVKVMFCTLSRYCSTLWRGIALHPCQRIALYLVIVKVWILIRFVLYLVQVLYYLCVKVIVGLCQGIVLHLVQILQYVSVEVLHYILSKLSSVSCQDIPRYTLFPSPDLVQVYVRRACALDRLLAVSWWYNTLPSLGILFLSCRVQTIPAWRKHAWCVAVMHVTVCIWMTLSQQSLRVRTPSLCA